MRREFSFFDSCFCVCVCVWVGWGETECVFRQFGGQPKHIAIMAATHFDRNVPLLNH